MRAIRVCFIQLLSCIKKDRMLFVICFIPLLVGPLIKFGIPMAESILAENLSVQYFLSPYYGLFDMFFAMLTPILLCFVVAMVTLEENDDRIAVYLFITPLGRIGYLFARFGVTAAISCIATLFLMPFFKLTDLTSLSTIFLVLGGTFQGVMAALMIVTLSSNKLEGMAVAKLSTLTVFGMVGPYFVHSNIQYVLSPLPTFWLGKAIYENKFIYVFPSMILFLVWIFYLLKIFLHKIS